MASGGTYRIESSSINKSFPAPETSWSEQAISNGLNGIPINTSYRIHEWSFGEMLGSDFDDLAALFDGQQSTNAQLTTLETDPYEADKSCNSYGTTDYTDFIIQSLSPRTRGLPHYQGVSVTFEVFIS